MNDKNSLGRVLSATFLVAGTSIGGGMLALPVATGINGFLPSMALMIVCFVTMTLTALLLLEAALWMEEGVHIISMTSRILGTPGKVISWCFYLFICYASLVAYTAGGGMQVAVTLNEYFSSTISKQFGSVIFLTVFGGVIYLGSRTVGRVNTILFLSMIVAYVILVTTGISEINLTLLTHREWTKSWLAIPLLLTSFSFQTMVPSLNPYLKRHIKSLRFAIIGGTFLTFIIYAIWQALILGIVPVNGPNGLAEALLLGEPAIQFLRDHVDGHSVYIIAEYFAFFAIITSFLGIAFGLYDFLADGLQINKKQGKGKVILGLLIIIPTLIFSTQFDRIFLVALEISGGFGDSVLNGIIPVLMVLVGRYWLKLSKPSDYRVAGGKPLLIGLLIFFSLTFILSIMMQLGLFTNIYEPYEVPAHEIMTSSSSLQVFQGN